MSQNFCSICGSIYSICRCFFILISISLKVNYKDFSPKWFTIGHFRIFSKFLTIFVIWIFGTHIFWSKDLLGGGVFVDWHIFDWKSFDYFNNCQWSLDLIQFISVNVNWFNSIHISQCQLMYFWVIEILCFNQNLFTFNCEKYFNQKLWTINNCFVSFKGFFILYQFYKCRKRKCNWVFSK
jgi:hypothetical protein